MKVLYWNCTSPGLGGNSFAKAKKDFIGEVVRTLDPDVVCLDEMSAGISDDSAADRYATNVLNGASVSYETGIVVENPGVHLNTSTWIKEGFAFKKIESGLPSMKWNTDKTKRDLTKVDCKVGTKDTAVWFLHANASASGGKAAANLAGINSDGTRMIFIGDFNCPIGKALSAVSPNVGGHNFTQWKRDAHGHASVPGRTPPVKYEPHDIIDYAICDQAKVTIAAVDSVGLFGADGFLNFIVNFDHFPVVYDIF